MSDIVDRPICSVCGFPLDEYNAGLRYFGTHTAHVEWYCSRRMKGEIERLRAEVAEKDRHLKFIERWANHHGAKPSISPQEALAVIQHYPPIKDITRSYVDGKAPETPDPYAEIAALKAANRDLIAHQQDLRAEVERLNKCVQYEQHRAERIGTHGSDCWKWGPAHYECAMAEVERYKPLMQAAEWILEDGHMNQEHLARLRAAWEAV